MSITASWLVLAIIAVRLLFRKTPKWILCLLWGLVAVRLICPFSIESALSLIPNPEPLPQDIIYTAHPQLQSGIVIIDNTVNPMLESSMTPIEPTSANPTQIWSFILSQIWILGMVLMLLYTVISYLLLKRKVATAIPLGKGIKQSEFVDSPFVLGIIRPVIYLPFGMEEADMAYVIAHEKAHIRRRDHWWKPLGFLLLSIYWFNPVLWVAYILLCRDIEAACDEKVIKDMKLDDRRAYSTALLNCSIHRRRIAACPLAFGETGVKARVKGIMNYRKPAFWIILIAMVTCIIISVCFLTDPTGMHLYEIDDSRNYSDLFTNTEDITLIREGEEYPVYDTEELLKQLDEVKVRKLTLNRSRSEDRDKTNRIHLREKLYLNFSWDYTHVWIDNLVKPTYTYRVINPDQVRTIFETLAGVNRKLIAHDVTPTSATVVCFPEDAYSEVDAIWDSRYWLEHWDGNAWNEVKATGEKGMAEIDVNRILDEGEENKHYVDWTTSHGVLSGGKYRLGTKFYFLESDILRIFYAEFSISNNVYAWFDFDADDPADRRLKDDTVDLFGMEGTALSCDVPYNEICLVNAEGMTPVISTDLMIRSAYLTDLTGDGIVEVCASVQKDAGMVIQVYDPSEERLYELAGDDGSYFLTKKADRLCVLRKDIYWITLDYGILGFSNERLGAKKLEMQEIDSSLEALTKRISFVEVLNRRVVSLSRLQEIEKMMGFLESLKQQVKPAPGDVLQKAQEDTFNSILITIHYELGEKSVYFSEDYHLVWVYGSKEGFEIADPEPLKSYVDSLTNGVLRQETYGQAFATVDAPWDWCKYVTSASIESAKEHVCLYTYRNGNSFGSSSTNGVLSYDTLQQLLSILNQIPKDAFVKDKIVEKQSYHSLFVDQQGENTSVALVDGVNDLAVIFNYRDGKTTMLLTDEMEKVSQIDSAYLEPTQLWSIQDQNLTAFMQEIFADPPVITYTIGAEYEWQDLMEFSADEFSLSLYLIEGWEHEYVQNRTSSGIRCRPEGITEGWIYFSFWPEGHVVKEENRFYLDGSWHGFPSKQSYPSSVSTPEGFNTSDAIWSYKAVYTDIGDYVIINDGADSWFMEYKDQIEDTISLSSFTVE